MSVVRKLKICTKEHFENRGGKPQTATYRVGQLIEFRDDETGKQYFRGKLSLFPEVKLYITDED